MKSRLSTWYIPVYIFMCMPTMVIFFTRNNANVITNIFVVPFLCFTIWATVKWFREHGIKTSSVVLLVIIPVLLSLACFFLDNIMRPLLSQAQLMGIGAIIGIIMIVYANYVQRRLEPEEKTKLLDLG